MHSVIKTYMTKNTTNPTEGQTSVQMIAEASQTCFDMCKETWHNSKVLPRKQKKEVRQNIRRGIAGVHEQLSQCGLMVSLTRKGGKLAPIRSARKLLKVIVQNIQ